jgi:hypothetical protein
MAAAVLGITVSAASALVNINSQAYIAGYADGADSFRGRLGQVKMVAPPPDRPFICVFRENDAGVAVGLSMRADTGADEAFVLSAYNFTFLNQTLNSFESSALDINASAVIVGGCDFGVWGSQMWAFAYDSGTGNVRDLRDALGPNESLAYAINDHGAVIGLIVDVGPFILSDGQVLDPTEGHIRFPVDINNAGDALLTQRDRQPDGSYKDHPVIFRGLNGQGTIDIPMDDGYGIAMNPQSNVVGSQVAGEDSYVAWRWSEEEGVQYLNDLIDPGSGWDLHQATGINADGTIVGLGKLWNHWRLFQFGGKPPFDMPFSPGISQHILWGVAQDGGGKTIPYGGGPPHPVPPWQDRLARALAEAASALRDEG